MYREFKESRVIQCRYASRLWDLLGVQGHTRNSGTCWWGVGFSGMLGYTGDSRFVIGVQGHAGGVWGSVAW